MCEKTLEQYFEEEAQENPMRSIDELDLLTQTQLFNTYVRGDTVSYLYDRLKRIYEHVPDGEDFKDAQYKALSFLYQLRKETNERASEVFYKRDERGMWETCTFEELASDHRKNWEALALWDALFASRQIGDSLASSLDKIEESFLDAHDRAGVFLTTDKPDDFEE